MAGLRNCPELALLYPPVIGHLYPPVDSAYDRRMLPRRRDLPDSSDCDERTSFSDFCPAWFVPLLLRIVTLYAVAWMILLGTATMRCISVGCLLLALSCTPSALPPGVARVVWLAFAALFLSASRRGVSEKCRRVSYLLLAAFVALRFVVAHLSG